MGDPTHVRTTLASSLCVATNGAGSWECLPPSGGRESWLRRADRVIRELAHREYAIVVIDDLGGRAVSGAKACGRTERPERGRVIRIRIQYINRAMVRTHTDTLFVFGDNMAGHGMGGQAAAMRGEPNAIGVPTKWAPERKAAAYFTDDDRLNRDVWHAIREAFDKMRAVLEDGRNVVIPSDGLGTGLAEPPVRAPKLHAMIEDSIAGLEIANAP